MYSNQQLVAGTPRALWLGALAQVLREAQLLMAKLDDLHDGSAHAVLLRSEIDLVRERIERLQRAAERKPPAVQRGFLERRDPPVPHDADEGAGRWPG